MKFGIASLLLITTFLILLNAGATVPLAQPEADMRIKNMTPSPDKAFLYVYRDNLLAGSAVMYHIYINEQRMDGRMAVNTFLAVSLKPGEYRLASVPSHLEPGEGK